VHADVVPNQPPPPANYVDVIRLDNPKVPATRPLVNPVDLRDAAHLQLSEPLYVDPIGQVWITRDDAPVVDRYFFRHVSNDQVHLVNARVLFVAWHPVSGELRPIVICADKNDPAAGPTAVSATQSTVLSPRHYFWDRAIATLDTLFVPTDVGISAFALSTLAENYHDLLAPDERSAVAAGRSKIPPPRIVFDYRRQPIVWIPCDEASSPGSRPARFADNAWTDLSSADWSDRLLHLIPLADGTVLELIHNADDSVALRLTPLDKLPVDEHHVGELVDKLASLDPNDRDAASAELTALGPAAWSMLEKVAGDQPPEAQARIQIILQNRTAPTIAGLTSPTGQLRVMAANRSGGVVLYAPSMEQANPDGPARVISPAWLQLIPGRPLLLLPPQQTASLDVDRDRFVLCGDDLLIVDPVLGLRWFDGGVYRNLTRKSETDFQQLVDRDNLGRWFLTRPPTNLPTLPPATGPATNAVANAAGPSTNPAAKSMTLVIDPTISDPTPRLPVWMIDTAPESGWDAENWPAIKAGGAWRLRETDWEPVDESRDPFAAQMPPPATPPTTQPSARTAPATNPTPLSSAPTSAPTTVSDLSSPQPILISADGTRYYDGLTTLTVVRPDHSRVVWPLPPAAIGEGSVTLLQAHDGNLFLFNAGGRVVRIHPTAGAAEPFELDAVFTHGIPNIDQPTRIWLDPAGRLAISDGKLLWVMFPDGRIPLEIREKMPASQDEDDQ
jgi:hypothetical protein